MSQYLYETPLIIHPPDDLPNLHALRRMSQRLALKYASQEVVTENDLEKVGKKLFDALDILDRFDEARGKSGSAILPIIIESASGEIQALPWESLYHPEIGFIGKDLRFTLSRRLKVSPSALPPLLKGPLRILLFTALPDDLNPETGRLNVEEEQAQVQEALFPWIDKGLVNLKMPDDGRFSTFEGLLKSFAPQVVFLSGHGHFHYQPHTGESPYGTFVFENKYGKSEPIRDEVIANSFAGSSIQAVILASCESGKAVSSALNDGLIQKISASGVPHVIGMRESLFDKAGHQFAHAICAEFAGGGRVDFSLQVARSSIVRPVAGMTASFGQWVLPTLYSPAPEHPLIDWEFAPLKKKNVASKTLSSITLPPRFVGRRAELRQYKSRIFDGDLKNLLITGAGGEGKTSLAGKLALDLQQDNYKVFVWSAKNENSLQAFENEMQLSLSSARVKRYTKELLDFESDQDKISFLLHLLVEEFQGRLVVFFDNLETVQDERSLRLKDENLENWIKAASQEEGLILLVTSRWKIPVWNGEHLLLTHATYGDFLQMVENLLLQGKLPQKYSYGEKARQIYDILGGNGRGLEFFVSAVNLIKGDREETEFLVALKNSRNQIQADMAIDKIYSHISKDAQSLLRRLPAFHIAVPIEGIAKLGVGLNTEKMLARLIDVSFVEIQEKKEWDMWQYQLSPLVREWLYQSGLVDVTLKWRELAADYQIYLFEEGQRTLEQAKNVYVALQRAKRKKESHRWVLDNIVGTLNRAGLHQTILEIWLPPIAKSKDKRIRAEAVNQIGKQYLHLGKLSKAMSQFRRSLGIFKQIDNEAGVGVTLNNIGTVYQSRGDYETALIYMQNSLKTRQETGDKAGEWTTLNNISQIFKVQGRYKIALQYLLDALEISRQIGDKAGEGTTLNNISQVYDAQGNYDIALEYLQSSLKIGQEIGDKTIEEATLNNISQIYNLQGNYEVALQYLQSSLKISRQIGNKSGEGTSLGNIGGIYKSQGNYEVALNYLQTSLKIRQEIGDKSGEASIQSNIGNLFKAKGDYKIALKYLHESLEISQQIGDITGTGGTLNNIATVHQAQGDYDKAHQYLQDSLKIRRKLGDKAGEGATLNNIATIHQVQGDYEIALIYMKKSLEIRQKIGDKAGEGATLNNIATVYQSQGNYDFALRYMKESLKISQEIGDRTVEGITLGNIGNILKMQGDYEGALVYMQNSLKIRQEIGDKAGEGIMFNNVGQIYKANSNYKIALQYLKKSLTISQQLGDKFAVGTILNNISQIYSARGDYDIAIQYLQDSLDIRQEIGDKAGEGATLNNISQIYDAQGDYERALVFMQDSLKISQKIGDKKGEGTVLSNISGIYYVQGNYETALQYLLNSLRIFKQLGDKAGEGTVLNNISQIYDAQGDYDIALQYLQDALSISQRIGDRAGEGVTLNNTSQIYTFQGDYETALQYLLNSLEISQSIGDKPGEGSVMGNIGNIFKAQGDYETALNYLHSSLKIHRTIGNKAGEGATLNNIATVYQIRGEYEIALQYLQESIEIREKIGDVSGACSTLYNMGHIYAQKKDMQEAMKIWVTSYKKAKLNNEYRVLQALAQLAPHLDLPAGLEGWEELENKSEGNE